MNSNNFKCGLHPGNRLERKSDRFPCSFSRVFPFRSHPDRENIGGACEIGAEHDKRHASASHRSSGRKRDRRGARSYISTRGGGGGFPRGRRRDGIFQRWLLYYRREALNLERAGPHTHPQQTPRCSSSKPRVVLRSFPAWQSSCCRP